ncbi:MAG: hypothetical protein HY673_24720 [Chloroflexi bacterium]|nr:hypothetical protein [Chloroflexota bacterium]
MKETVIAAIAGVVLLSIGIVLIWWPRRVQSFIVKYYEGHPLLLRFEYLYEWILSPGYVRELRIGGVIGIPMGTLMFAAPFLGRMN